MAWNYRSPRPVAKGGATAAINGIAAGACYFADKLGPNDPSFAGQLAAAQAAAIAAVAGLTGNAPNVDIVLDGRSDTNAAASLPGCGRRSTHRHDRREVVKMDIESPESRIKAILANLREQGVGEDWIQKIVEDYNAMLDRTPGVSHVRDQAMLALTAMRKRKADAKAPTNGINELLSVLDRHHWTGRILENVRGMMAVGERLESVDWFVLVTNRRRITRDEAKATGRTVTETSDSFYARQFESDAYIRGIQADTERASQPAPKYGRNSDFPNGVRP